MLNVSPLNLLFTVLNLLILLVLMKKFLYQPVLGIMEKRKELIEGQFAEAKASKEEARQLREQYEACLSDTKEEQAKMIKEAKAKAGIEYDKILADADQKAKQILEDAKRSGQEEKAKAMKSAEAEIAGLAIKAASKIVSQSSDEKSDYVIYEEFLKKAGENSGTDNK